MEDGLTAKNQENGLPVEVDRARRLFLYLRDLTELRSKPTRDVDQYEQVVWFSELPGSSGAWSSFHEPDGTEEVDIWLSIERVPIPPPPEPVQSLGPWLQWSVVDDFELDEPGLVEIEALDEGPPDDVLQAYSDYLTGSWRPWAERCRELKQGHDFYTRLFAMSERQRSLGEIYELVVSIGLLAWIRNEHAVRRHLLTTPVEINVDPDTGVIEVRPSDTEGRNRLELDMLDPVDRGPASVVEEISSEVERLDPLVLGRDAARLLNRWLNQAHSQGHLETSLVAPRPGQELKLALAPALILRKRGQRTLTELLGSIADSIRATEQLTENIFSLVSTDDRPSSSSDELKFADPEVYFPLPANGEQLRIVHRMGGQRGVVVQGPPGTGKSHTIANLISHLLAQGKRTLVTSHTERALKVLRDKLPEDIKPLCIALLGGDRQSIQDLEAAIGSISARQSGWSVDAAETRIAQLRSTLQTVRGLKTEKMNLLRQVRESDTYPTTIGRYRGTSQEIAESLSSERSRLGWIPDLPDKSSPPLTAAEFLEYLDLRWDLPEDADATARSGLPDVNHIAPPGSVDQLFLREKELGLALEAASLDHGDWVSGLARVPEDELRAAVAALDEHRALLTGMATAGPWTHDAITDITRGRTASWQALQADLIKYHNDLDAALSSTGGTRIEIPSTVSVDAARAGVRELLAVAEAKGRIRTGLFAPGVVREHRELLDGLRVDGAQALEASLLRKAEAYLTALIALENVRLAWGGRLQVDVSRSFTQQRASLKQELDALTRLLGLEQSGEAVLSALKPIAGIPAFDLADESDVVGIARGLSVADLHRRAAEVDVQIAEVRSAIGQSNHAVAIQLRDSVDRRDADAYREAMSDLEAVLAVAAGALRRRELSDRLAKSPRLLADLTPTRDIAWVEKGQTFEDAWHWAYANAELERVLDPEEPRRLSLEIKDLESREKEALSELAAELAWLRMFESLSREQSQALTAWTKAVKLIGKGTGKYAPEHRRVAREYMGKARDAIPAWIMPMYRVAESVGAVAEPFDVVIIDEASQSGVESLFLFYLAKQVIVVGDDKQIAPDPVGLNKEEVMRLQNQYLEGLPFFQLFQPTVSLFDQADTRFPGAPIRLTEHFRCMPEIIEFSNRLAYAHEPLVPLRQFGADRLDPIKTVYLPFGYREGDSTRAINRAEADEIVARIEKCCADQRYDDLTFGVVSLQGDAQARLIEGKLIERLGPQVMLERKIVCGDAYAFQGDERDVIFLSMVAATNSRPGSLADEAARRRFNVAASRARDQVWLVHSVMPEDLSRTDMRRELLEYYLHPEVEHLEELADFDDSVLNRPFESLFEQGVYLDIRRRGYKVVPQVRSGEYRIDLVIEGGASRLAVECDGDKWHGPEQWEADMARQRQLERAGWRFERIRGSAYFLDPAVAMQPVWTACAAVGIEPGASEKTTYSATAVDPITGVEPGNTNADSVDSLEDSPVSELTAVSEPDRTIQLQGQVHDVVSPQENEVVGRHIATDERSVTTPSYEPPVPEFDLVAWESEQGSNRLTSSRDAYEAWDGSGLPDPRKAPPREMARHLIEIVSIEGPVTTDRLYSVYIKGAGFSRVTRPARGALNRSLHLLSGDVDIDEFQNPETAWPQRVVRVRGTNPIRVRERGPRDLYEVPLNEIAELVAAEAKDSRGLAPNEFLRTVLEGYGLRNLTQRALRYLGAAIQLIPDEDLG